MSGEIRQSRRFTRAYKKLHDNITADVDDAVEKIADNPDIGEKKRGDLSHLRVYKFHTRKQLWLLGYSLEEEIRLIYLEAFGPHENLYRDLKH